MLWLSSGTVNSGSWSTFEFIVQLFFILLVFVGIIILAYFATRWMASAKYVKKGNSNLRLIESIGLGYQNGIHLLKAGKKYVLLGITKDKIDFLCELSADDIEEINEDRKVPPSFENYLSRILDRNKSDN